MSQHDDKRLFSRIIPELGEWNEGKGIEAEDWIYIKGRYDLAVGYSLIYWPRFVEFEGYILRSGFAIDSLRGFEKQSNNNRATVESVMNSIDLGDIHRDNGMPSEEQVQYLGMVLRDLHELKLSRDFPNRNFEIAINDDLASGYLDSELTFWQVD
ncbi:MAG: hypothetical protein AAFO91_05300 [Bacteroidota bacterium]